MTDANKLATRTEGDNGTESGRSPQHTAAPELLSALKALKLECLADHLNPCWDNRPSDRPGLHWGSEEGAPVPACSSCNARAAIAKAEVAA